MAKQYGGWYDNPATGKNERWWGEGIWTSGAEPAGGGQQSVANLSSGMGALSFPNMFGYDLESLQGQVKGTYEKLQSAQSGLGDYQMRRYEEEYSKSGLEDIKKAISTLDTSISSEKNVRDESVSKVRKNPGYSAATITGEVAEIQKLANAKINNLIDERNTKAGDYNIKLGEVEKKVAMETQAKQTEVATLQSNLNFLTGLVSTYEKMRQTELAAKTEAERWEKEFELKLYSAQTSRISATKTGTSGRAMQQVKDAWGNVIGYFDPTTGQTSHYQQSESQTAAPMTVASSGLRMKIREAWKQGYTADQLKSTYAGATTDRGESVSEIIDDEWRIKTASGVGGFLGRLFRRGV